jgi:hypothetical protein
MACDTAWKDGDIYRAVGPIGRDGLVLIRIYRVRDDGLRKLDETMLRVGAGGNGRLAGGK